ncbi:MAG: nucleotidyltransferase domain-containing protein [Nanoarchaeota archaeon]|nr:nucleotidyltransferase domain-containing protein [Nanoarchaeota archaeon]
MNSKLIAFALDFSSYLLQKIKEKDKIKNIILFGSVARNEETKESDIDIFIDITKESKEIERDIKKVLDSFYNSSKYKEYWKLLEIENKISLTIGRLDNWKDLKSSITANGLILYGKFRPLEIKGEYKTFFIWENIKPNSKRVLFNKQLLGYKQNKKFYNGLLQKFNGVRLGKGCILVLSEHDKIFHSLFKKYRANVKIKRVLEY